MKIKRFKQTQKFRVIVGSVSFYTTAKQIRNGVGDFIKCNDATRQALESLEETRAFGGIMAACVGHVGTWGGIQVQLDMA